MQYTVKVGNSSNAQFAEFAAAEDYVKWQMTKYPNTEYVIIGISFTFAAFYRGGKRVR